MRLFYGGAEAPTLRRRLKEAGASRFSVSYWHLRDRLPKSGKFPFDERFPPGTEILLDSGGYTANKRADDHDDDFWVDYINDYVELVGNNIDRLTLVTEFDFLDYSTDDLWALRFDVWSAIPVEKFLPVWHKEHGFEELVKLARAYPRVAVAGDDLEAVAHRLPSLGVREGCLFHGLSTNSQDLIERAALASASSTGWVSSTRYGERVVFDGTKLRRYGGNSKDAALTEHRGLIQKAGLDLELLEEEDPGEITRLTVWAFDAWSEFLTRKMGVHTPSEPQDEPTSAQTEDPEPATSAPGALNSLVARTPGETKLLPILSVSEGTQRTVGADGSEEVKSETQISSRGDSARQCDSCYIARACPEYKPGEGCAYDIPVQIRSKEQLNALLSSVIEMQGQRALFARFAEELEGGYPSGAVSKEFDRLFALTEKFKDIQDNRDFLRISVEGKANGGVLSRLFGEQAGARSRELDHPIERPQIDQYVSDVIDAEVVD